MGTAWRAYVLPTGGPRFGLETKLAQNARASDTYVQYTPNNTPCPLATWHTFATAKAMAYHQNNAKVLEKYLNNTGEYYQDVAWLKHGRRFDETPYTVFDTETTGLKNYDRIIQIAASQVGAGHRVNHHQDFNTLVNPGVNSQQEQFKIKPGATEVHGITDEMVKDKPTLASFLPAFRNERMRKNGLVVAYNAKFDIQFLNNAIQKYNQSAQRKQAGYLRPLETALVVDPFVLIQRLHPFVSLRKRLGDHFEILMGRPLENKHDAQADVDATVDVLKYCVKKLEKHAIPLQWAKFVAERLPKREWQPGEKAAIIARCVRENREALVRMMPVPLPGLKVTDVLQFQHGAPVYHPQTDLPLLDITLNMFGWDGSKRWDGSDTLDVDVARQVRTERDAENRAYLTEKFMEGFEAPGLKGLGPDIAEALQAAVLSGYLTALMTHQLPADAAGWEAHQAQVASQLSAAVETHVPGNQQAAVREKIPTLAQELNTRMQTFAESLGGRFFYSLVPVDDKPLIDPSVLEVQHTLSKKRGRRAAG